MILGENEGASTITLNTTELLERNIIPVSSLTRGTAPSGSSSREPDPQLIVPIEPESQALIPTQITAQVTGSPPLTVAEPSMTRPSFFEDNLHYLFVAGGVLVAYFIFRKLKR